MLLYIDPGTGSMLFTILIGVISAGIYGIRGFFMKLKYSSKENVKENKDVIPYVIFSDSKRYWNIFRMICDEFESREIPLTYYTMSEDDPAFDYHYKYITREYIGDGNGAFAKMNFLKADVVLSTTPGLDVYQWKRSKDAKYYIHIPHAVDDLTSYRMFGLDYYDAVLLSGNHISDEIRQLEKMRNLPSKDIQIVGLTYFDELEEKIQNNPRKENEKPIILLAPSWGPSSILNKYGSKAIDALLSTGYKIVVRPHPQSKTSEKDMLDNLMKKYPDLEWNFDNDNFDILNRADLLISDFSGVIFDFALVFGKPIIYADTSFDKGPYDAWWLDEEMWKFKVLPELGEQLKETDLDNIKPLIDECLNSISIKENIEKVKAECWKCRGESAKNIVDYMISRREVNE